MLTIIQSPQSQHHGTRCKFLSVFVPDASREISDTTRGSPIEIVENHIPRTMPDEAGYPGAGEDGMWRDCTVQNELMEWVTDKELLLLLGDFKSWRAARCGSCESESSSAEDLSPQSNGKDSIADTVVHVLDPPFVSNFSHPMRFYSLPFHRPYRLLFCRFAIRGVARPDSACLTAVGSHLLPRSIAGDCLSTSGHADLRYALHRPMCWACQKGFSQASYNIYAALPFDHHRDLTWKVCRASRARSSRLTDGNIMAGATSGVHSVRWLRRVHGNRLYGRRTSTA